MGYGIPRREMSEGGGDSMSKCDWRKGDTIRYLRGKRYVVGAMWRCSKCGGHMSGGQHRSPPRDGCVIS